MIKAKQYYLLIICIVFFSFAYFLTNDNFGVGSEEYTAFFTSPIAKSVDFSALPTPNRVSSVDSLPIDELHRLGNEALEERKYDTAIMYYTQILIENPKEIESIINRGKAYYYSQNIKRAILDFNQVLEIDSKDIQGYMWRGRSYIAQKNYTKAIIDFEKALQLDPKAMQVYVDRGNAYYKLQNYERAVADVNVVIDNFSNNATLYLYRGRAYLRYKDYERAIVDFNKALGIAPDDASVHNFVCWHISIDPERKNFNVMDICNRAVNLDPYNGNYRDSRAVAYSLGGHFEAAIEDFKFFVEWSKKNFEYETFGRIREVWIADLKNGKNPFDEEETYRLLDE